MLQLPSTLFLSSLEVTSMAASSTILPTAFPKSVNILESACSFLLASPPAIVPNIFVPTVLTLSRPCKAPFTRLLPIALILIFEAILGCANKESAVIQVS